MYKNYYLKFLCSILVVLGFILPSTTFGQTNEALTATATQSSGGTGVYGPALYNDGLIASQGSCSPGASTVWGWVSGGGNITYTWSSAVFLNKVVFYFGDRPMDSCIIRYWNGTDYDTISHYHRTNCPVDSITFSTISTTILEFRHVSGLNPNFREIQAWLVDPYISGTTTHCAGDTLSLTANSTQPSPTYVWSGPASFSATGATITIPGLTTANSGVYTVTETSGVYTLTNTATVTVNPLANPGVIMGATGVCIGSNITLHDSISAGTWSISNGHATLLDSIVTGLTFGVDTISFSVTNMCGTQVATHIITTDTLPTALTITGANSVCVGAHITLYDSTSGGTWSFSNSMATNIDSIATGVSAGVDTLSYSVTNGCGTQVASHVITINPLANPGVITGASNVCVGASITLNDTVTGGTGSISNDRATLLDSIVTGVTAGVDTVSYSVSNGCGTQTAVHIVTVNPLPDSGSITGISNVCVSTNITLSDAVSGGVWSVTNSNSTISGGVVTGAIAGIDTVKYVVTTFCGTATATKAITINPLPYAAPISGTGVVCVGSTSSLSDSVLSGVWHSASTTLATIDTSGVVHGVSAGVDTIQYSYTNMCGTGVAVLLVTVNPLPDSGIISGIDTVCAGTTITLSETVASGVWTTSNTSISTISGGVVMGVSSGTDTVLYTVTNSCGIAIRSMPMITKPLPVAGILTGTDSVCTGTSVTISSTSTDGVWSLTNANATVVGGVVTGVTAGLDTIVYKVTNYCGLDSVKYNITVKPQPFAGIIYGMDSVCVAAATTLADSAMGGVWTIGDTIHAMISGGVVTGLVAGTDSVNYVVTNYCGTATASVLVVVNPLPNAGLITDASDTFTVCIGAHRILTVCVCVCVCVCVLQCA